MRGSPSRQAAPQDAPESPERSDPAFDVLAAVAERLLDDPDDEVAARLDQIAEQTESWTTLAAVYRELASRPLTVTQQVEIRYRLGVVYNNRLNEPERALRTLQRVLDVQPTHVGACAAVEGLLAYFGRFQELADMLVAQCRAGAGPRTVLVHLKLAEVVDQHLGQPDAAARTYLQVLAIDPEQPEALAQLERLLLSGHAPAEAAEPVERSLEASGEWARLVALLQTRLQTMVDGGERLALLERIALIHEQELRDATNALATRVQWLLEHPEPDAAADHVERLAAAADGWQVAADGFAALLERGQLDGSHRGSFLRRLGAALDRLGQDRAAVAAYGEALELDASDTRAVDALCSLYDRLAEHALLAEALRRRIDLTFVWELSEPLWLRLAELLETRLNDLPGAAECCERVLARAPDSARAFECLERIYTAEQRWPELLDLYERWVQTAGDELRADLHLRMAQLASDRLHDDARALSLWERLFTVRPARDTDWAAIAALHRRTENWRGLAHALEQRLSLNDDAAVQLELYAQLAHLKERELQDLEGAAFALEQMQLLDPGNPDGLRALARLYRLTASWNKFVHTIRKLVMLSDGSDDASRAQLIADLAEVARVADEQLGNSRMAIEACRDLLNLAPDHASTLRRAGRLMAGEQRWAECAGVLERLGDVAEDATARLAALREAATVYEEHLDDGTRACALWRRVLGEVPDDPDAARHLDRLYRQGGELQALAELLEQQARLRPADPRSAAMFAEAAELFEQALDDPSAAYRALTGLLDVHADYESRFDDIERLAERLAVWPELIAGYRALAEKLQPLPEGAGRAAVLWSRIARIHADRLNHKREALTAMQTAATLAPDATEVQDALAALLRDQHRWPELAAELRAQTARVTDPERKLRLLWQLAELLEVRLADSSGAAEVYRELVAEDPGSVEAIDKLERMCRRQLDWAGVVSVLERRIELTWDVEAQLALRLEQARLWSTKLRDADKAAEAYDAALALDPLCGEALRALCEHYRKVGPPERYVEMLELEAEAAEDDRARAVIYERMAGVQEMKCGDEAGAAASLEKALALEPRNPSAYRRLERHYAKMQDWPALIDVYSRHLAMLDGDPGWVEIARAKASVYEDKFVDLRAALALYEEITRRADDVRAATKVERLRAALEEEKPAED